MPLRDPGAEPAPATDEPQKTPWSQQGYSRLALPAVALILLVGATGVLLYLQQQIRNHQFQVAVEDARSFARSVVRFRDFYSTQIVPRALESGMRVTHEFTQVPNSIPLPATLTLDFGEFISAGEEGYRVKLFSEYPFPWRKVERKLDTFQREALVLLAQDGSQPLVRVEEREGERILRVAVPDYLAPNCVACHNSYPGTPKTDWKAGDLRGVLEVSRSLSASEGMLAGGMRDALLMSFFLIAATVLILWLLVRSLYQGIGESQRRAEAIRLANRHLRDEILQRRKVEDVLRFNEEKLRATFDGVLEAVIVIDQRGVILQENRVAREIFGYAPGEMQGHNVSCLMPEPHTSQHDAYLHQYIQGGAPKIIGRARQVEARRRDGTHFPVLLGVSEVRFGEERFFVGILADITEQQKKETDLKSARDAALESARLKSEFLANMSHEIRTPMNGVIGMTHLLRDTGLSADQLDLVETLERSSRALLEIINDILDLSKIEAGKLELNADDFDPVATVEDVVKLFSGAASQKGLVLALESEPQITRWARGDEGRFRQVMSNLIGNAVKFTNAGSVRVRLRAGAQPHTLSVRVEDSGIGIPPAQQHRLFQPFTQVDGSSSRRYGGTGLGLAISRQLVERMGGEIGLESVAGQGSVFFFRLPLAAPQQPLATQAAATPNEARLQEETSAEFATASVLVAEDNGVNQKLIRGLLARMQLQPVIVENGERALQELEAGNYAVVLMDCQMPVVDGFEATRRWRQREAELGRVRQVRIIALTANAMEGDREKCLQAGMDDYLSKPINPQLLKDKLFAVLREAARDASLESPRPTPQPTQQGDAE